MNRAERRRRTNVVAARRRREWLDLMGEDHWCPGLGRSRSLFDCGKPGCVACHYEKMFDLPRRQELRADDA